MEVGDTRTASETKSGETPMLANVLITEEATFFSQPVAATGNPWVSDHTLLNLAIWWVKMTQPQPADFAAEVAFTFDSLERDLRPVSQP
jgi:hypothetical protein